MTLLEDGAWDIQEEDGHNISFGFGTGLDCVLELAEEEKEEEDHRNSSFGLISNIFPAPWNFQYSLINPLKVNIYP
jgi:hypothetical protein